MKKTFFVLVFLRQYIRISGDKFWKSRRRRRRRRRPDAGDAEKIDFLKNNLNTIMWYLVGKKNSLRVFWRKNQLKIWIFGRVTAILVSAVDGDAVFPAPEITSGNFFFNFLIHLMDVYNCAKGHLPKCIINDFMAVGLIQPPPQYQAAPESPIWIGLMFSKGTNNGESSWKKRYGAPQRHKVFPVPPLLNISEAVLIPMNQLFVEHMPFCLMIIPVL